MQPREPPSPRLRHGATLTRRSSDINVRPAATLASRRGCRANPARRVGAVGPLRPGRCGFDRTALRFPELRASSEPLRQQCHRADQDRDDGKGAPPVLPQRGEPVARLSAGPKHAEDDQDNPERATYARHVRSLTERASPTFAPADPPSRRRRPLGVRGAQYLAALLVALDGAEGRSNRPWSAAGRRLAPPCVPRTPGGGRTDVTVS
jgi:hypothetical protein